MAIDILVPPLSQTMDTVTLVEWKIKIGDPVNKGDILFLVETDKATLDVEAPATGILGEILAEPGEEVAVRSRIGAIYSAKEYQSALKSSPTRTESQAVPPATGQPLPALEVTSSSASVTNPSPSVQQNVRLFSSPRARRFARLNHLELKEIDASGPRGMIIERDARQYLEKKKLAPKVTPLARRVAEENHFDLTTLEHETDKKRITRADVEQALVKQATPQAVTAEPDATAPANRKETGAQTVPFTNLRKTIAHRMLESHQTTAPVTLMREVDATELKELRTLILKEIGEEDVRPTYTDFLTMITARCLMRHTYMNGFIDGDAVILSEEVHIGLAVDLERGLLVPVIRSAQKRNVIELARERDLLVKRATENKSTPEELSGGTFTITNLGTLGIDAFTPIINQPQIAILGIGRIRPVQAVFNGQCAIREIVTLSLTFDHRAVDGAPAARFLKAIAQCIEKPHLIWM
jgi:pyruvate dehydrogenase E2 component (dihydrolipoamide acetyltransferase)